ncbi:MAG: preprotein translocase, partial [Chloroflexi bacterium]
MSVLTKVLGDPNAREVKRHLERVADINQLEPLMQQLSDDELKAKTAEFRNQLAEGHALDDLLVEAFAVVREAARR